MYSTTMAAPPCRVLSCLLQVGKENPTPYMSSVPPGRRSHQPGLPRQSRSEVRARPGSAVIGRRSICSGRARPYPAVRARGAGRCWSSRRRARWGPLLGTTSFDAVLSGLAPVCGFGTRIPALLGVLSGLNELETVVGRLGLEPSISALSAPRYGFESK